MESTWESRDLPVLDAVVRYFDEHDGAEIPDVATFGKLTGMDPHPGGPGGAGAQPTLHQDPGVARRSHGPSGHGRH